jgi:hypothetical protein
MSNIYPDPRYYHVPQLALPAPASVNLRPDACKLVMRQQPVVALVTSDGKEKVRKPIDPPPVVELVVSNMADPQQHHLQSPYIYAAVSLIGADTLEAPAGAANGVSQSLTGTLVSSLTRLKDLENRDGGFFVFGDISVKLAGRFRLEFHLFEFRDNMTVNIGSGRSAVFTVVTAKDFKGMAQSTQMSRSFSDQGCRLRLRKEPRTTNKRGYSAHARDSPDGSTRPRLVNDQSSSYDAESSPRKRFRAETEDRQETYTEPTPASASSFGPAFTSMTQFPLAAHATQGQTHQASPANYNGLHTSFLSLTSGASTGYTNHQQVMNPVVFSNQAYHANLNTNSIMPGAFSAPRGYGAMQAAFGQRTASSSLDGYQFDFPAEHRYHPN